MTPGLLGRYRLRRRLAADGSVEHWDAVDVDTGQRCVATVADGAVTAVPLLWTLDEVADDDTDGGNDNDVLLAAQVAVLLARAEPSPARPVDYDWLGAVAWVGEPWVMRLFGPAPSPAAARRGYLRLSPTDSLGIAELVGRRGSGPLVVAALATWLAAERHVLSRRAGLAVHDLRLLRLRAAAARLARFAPPREAGTALRSDGVTVAGASLLFDGQSLDPRATRAALRATASSPTPLRRWLQAMSRLRVDREILGRR